MSSGCGEGVLAYLVQRGEHLPCDVALESSESSSDVESGSRDLEGRGVLGGVVGRGALPACPDDPEPRPGDDAGGVRIAFAAGAGVGVQASGPG